MVSRGGQAFQYPPAAEVDPGDGLGVPVEAEVRPGGGQFGADQGGGGPVGELPVARDVVAVRVGVQHQQPVVVPGVAGEPVRHQVVYGRTQREVLGLRRRPGVDQDGPLGPEEQEQERRLVVDRLVLPEDDGVLVVRVGLDVRVRVVLRGRRAVDPRHAQRTGDRCTGSHDVSLVRRLGGPGTAHISSGAGAAALPRGR